MEIETKDKRDFVPPAGHSRWREKREQEKAQQHRQPPRPRNTSEGLQALQNQIANLRRSTYQPENLDSLDPAFVTPPPPPPTTTPTSTSSHQTKIAKHRLHRERLKERRAKKKQTNQLSDTVSITYDSSGDESNLIPHKSPVQSKQKTTTSTGGGDTKQKAEQNNNVLPSSIHVPKTLKVHQYRERLKERREKKKAGVRRSSQSSISSLDISDDQITDNEKSQPPPPPPLKSRFSGEGGDLIASPKRETRKTDTLLNTSNTSNPGIELSINAQEQRGRLKARRSGGESLADETSNDADDSDVDDNFDDESALPGAISIEGSGDSLVVRQLEKGMLRQPDRDSLLSLRSGQQTADSAEKSAAQSIDSIKNSEHNAIKKEDAEQSFSPLEKHDNYAPESIQKNNRRIPIKCMFLLVFLLALVAIAVGVGVGVGLGTTTRTSAANVPTAAPITGQIPSASPSMDPTSIIAINNVLESLSNFSFDGGLALQDNSSPQFRAAAWIATHENLSSFSTDRLMQRYALATVYFSTGGESSWDASVSSRWLARDQHECEWLPSGMKCNDNSEVIILNLTSTGLQGELTREIAHLSILQALDVSLNLNIQGSLPPEIGRLTKMERFMVHGNSLSGVIPSEMGLMTACLELGLQANDFIGSLPSQLGQLTSLTSLGLSFNKLESTLPTEIFLLTNLEMFFIESNLFDGAIPSEIGQLQRLEVLSLTKNEFSSTLPTQLGLLADLQVLNLNLNHLVGSLPSSLGDLGNITLLNVAENDLKGTIPTEFGMLKNAEIINLALNQLSGSVPSELGLLSNLSRLDLSFNRLTGNIPNEVQDLNIPNLLLSGNGGLDLSS